MLVLTTKEALANQVPAVDPMQPHQSAPVPAPPSAPGPPSIRPTAKGECILSALTVGKDDVFGPANEWEMISTNDNLIMFRPKPGIKEERKSWQLRLDHILRGVSRSENVISISTACLLFISLCIRFT